MIILKINDTEYELSTALRVVYELRTISGAKSLQDAVRSIEKLDIDGQLALIYAAYKAANNNKTDMLGKDAFTDLLLDTQGIMSIAEIVNKLADGLMYSGLSPEETVSKKAMVEKELLGATSSAKATD